MIEAIERIRKPKILSDGRCQITTKPGSVLSYNGGTKQHFSLHKKVYSSYDEAMKRIEFDIGGCSCGACLKDTLNECECSSVDCEL